MAARRASVRIGVVRPLGFLRWSSYFDMSSAKVRSTAAVTARMIPPWAAAPSRPRPRPARPEEALDALVAVLDEVRLGHSRSRSRARRRARASAAAIVAQRVGELLDRGLVVEGDPARAPAAGRPASSTFRADAGHVLVADLGATSIDVAMTTLDGRILGHHDEPRSIADGPDVALERVEELFEPAARDDARRCPGGLWGIGIGVPGPVESATGRPISPPIMPGWDGYPIRERLAARYGAPVWVDNDVNVLALGEWRSGVAAGHDNVVVVKVGTGIGAGIIVGRPAPPRGAGRRRATSATSRSPRTATSICRCGNVGCLEALAGGAAIGARRGGGGARGAEPAAARGAGPARGGDGRGRRAGGVVRRPGRGGAAPGAPAAGSARCSPSVVNFFNPSLVVIGGGVAQQRRTCCWPRSARRSTAGRCRSRRATC